MDIHIYIYIYIFSVSGTCFFDFCFFHFCFWFPLSCLPFSFSFSPKAIPRRRCIVFARSWGPGGALSTELLIDRCRAGAYARTYACARVKLLAKYEFRRFKLGISTSEIRISKFEIQNFVCEFWISVFEIPPQGYQYIPCQVGCRKWLERAAHLSRKYAAR